MPDYLTRCEVIDESGEQYKPRHGFNYIWGSADDWFRVRWLRGYSRDTLETDVERIYVGKPRHAKERRGMERQRDRRDQRKGRNNFEGVLVFRDRTRWHIIGENCTLVDGIKGECRNISAQGTYFRRLD